MMEEMLADDDKSKAISKMASINLDSRSDEEKGNERHNRLIDRRVKMVLKPNDVYRVPLMWLMPDSKLDLKIMTQREDCSDDEQDPLTLFTDIQSLFNQNADLK